MDGTRDHGMACRAGGVRRARVPETFSVAQSPLRRFVYTVVIVLSSLVFLGASSPGERLDDLPEVAARAGATEAARALPAGWISAPTRHLEIQYHPDHAGGVSRLLEQADDLLESASDQLGIQPSRRYVVRLARDRDTFEAVQPGRPPPWAAGTAYPKYGLMVLLTGEGALWRLPNGLEKVFVHETAHLLLGEIAKKQPLPRWFDEGVSRLVAGEFSMEEWTQLSRGVLLGKLIWFSELDRGFPIGEGRANLAYAQSRSFLSYLTNRFGADVLPAIVREVAAGGTLNEALWKVLHHGLTGLEEDWRTDLGRDMKWLSALFGGATLWGLIGLLVVIAYLKRKAQSRRRRALWADEEFAWYDDSVRMFPWPARRERTPAPSRRLDRDARGAGTAARRVEPDAGDADPGARGRAGSVQPGQRDEAGGPRGRDAGTEGGTPDRTHPSGGLEEPVSNRSNGAGEAGDEGTKGDEGAKGGSMGSRRWMH